MTSELNQGCLSPYFIADAAAKVAPAVVNITLHQERANEQFPDWFGRFQDRLSEVRANMFSHPLDQAVRAWFLTKTG